MLRVPTSGFYTDDTPWVLSSKHIQWDQALKKSGMLHGGKAAHAVYSTIDRLR
jgi:hypothetical protein